MFAAFLCFVLVVGVLAVKACAFLLRTPSADRMRWDAVRDLHDTTSRVR